MNESFTRSFLFSSSGRAKKLNDSRHSVSFQSVHVALQQTNVIRQQYKRICRRIPYCLHCCVVWMSQFIYVVSKSCAKRSHNTLLKVYTIHFSYLCRSICDTRTFSNTHSTRNANFFSDVMFVVFSMEIGVNFNFFKENLCTQTAFNSKLFDSFIQIMHETQYEQFN